MSLENVKPVEYSLIHNIVSLRTSQLSLLQLAIGKTSFKYQKI